MTWPDEDGKMLDLRVVQFLSLEDQNFSKYTWTHRFKSRPVRTASSHLVTRLTDERLMREFQIAAWIDRSVLVVNHSDVS